MKKIGLLLHYLGSRWYKIEANGNGTCPEKPIRSSRKAISLSLGHA